jgi:hypothetical protein
MRSYKNRVEMCGLTLTGSGYGKVLGVCEHGNEPSDSTKGGGFFD